MSTRHSSHDGHTPRPNRQPYRRTLYAPAGSVATQPATAPHPTWIPPETSPEGLPPVRLTDLEATEAVFAYAPGLRTALAECGSLDEARAAYYGYLSRARMRIARGDHAVALDRATARDCLHVLESIGSPRNERLADTGAVALLWQLARGETPEDDIAGFAAEALRLFAGIEGASGLHRREAVTEGLEGLRGRQAALRRSEGLDKMAQWAEERMARYPSGLEEDVVRRRCANAARIRHVLGASEEDWADWRWHIRNTVNTLPKLEALTALRPAEKQAVSKAVSLGLPFGMTPYHVSLFDHEAPGVRDAALRAQVLPPPSYLEALEAGPASARQGSDFMGETDTSPASLVTRRYPMVCIVKPFGTCAQVCVYCQRNWELRTIDDPNAGAKAEDIDSAIDFVRRTPAIREVLVTGGDPLLLSTDRLHAYLERIARIDHVDRIRLGSRTPVVLPQRVTKDLADALASLREVGRREVCVMTHFQHPSEVTPEAALACSRLRDRGLAVYNQMVFTTQNARRFEAAALRRVLRLIGVDPYYTFCPKGKPETQLYRVPIARIVQEAKEDARLLPGLVRTDEAVFNVPRLGKTRLCSAQDRELIGILPSGERVYEFHPWEKNMYHAETYVYTDVSISDFLAQMAARGEDPADYESIWYYH